MSVSHIFTTRVVTPIILLLVSALYLSACVPQTTPTDRPIQIDTETPAQTSGFRFDAWRETPPVQVGSSLPLMEMGHSGPEPLSDSDMVSTGVTGEALLTGQMGEYTCSVYLFFNSSLTKSACPRSAASGNTSCQSGSAAYRDCDMLLIQTPSGEAYQLGSWSLVTYLEDRQLSLFVAAEGSLDVQPVLDFTGRSLGEPIAVRAGQFLYTAPDASLQEIAGLPAREPIAVENLTELAAELPELLPWLARARVRADEAGIPFPQVESRADLTGELIANGDPEIETVERGQERGLLVPLQGIIKNLGDGDAEAFQSAILNSDGSELVFTPTDGRAAQGLIQIESVPAGGEVEFTGWARIPPSLAAPRINLNLFVDFCRAQDDFPESCRVDELDEGNNRSAPLTVLIPEDLLQELENPFTGAYIYNVDWLENRIIQVTIQLEQNVPGDYFARVNRLDFRCQVLGDYPNRLYCTGPELQPGDVEIIDVFDNRDGTRVFSAEFSVPAYPAPPRGGVSLNCDDTFQRITIYDGGELGKTVLLDNWDGFSWDTVWALEGGDPMMRQIEDSAGLYQFGGCEQLVVVPLRYTGSGAVLELSVFRWNGTGLDQVYYQDGVHGTWVNEGEYLIFERSVYLYGEPNCCPCNREIIQHRWTGEEFIEISRELEPTYSDTGTPPPECQSLSIPLTSLPLMTPVPPLLPPPH